MVAKPFVAPRLCFRQTRILPAEPNIPALPIRSRERQKDSPIPGLRARTMQNETQIPGLGLGKGSFTSDELRIGNESQIWASKMLSGR